MKLRYYLICVVQFTLVLLAAFTGAVITTLKIRKKLIVGTVEIANVLHSYEISDLRTYTVCLYPNFRYPLNNYSYKFRISSRARLDYVRRLIIAPRIFGYGLIGKSDFLLLGEKSFLESRKLELILIKFFNRKSVVQFLGDDIRSPILTRIFMAENGLDTFVNSSWYAHVNTTLDEYELLKRKIAIVNQKYADLILTAPYDQLGYLNLDSGNIIFAHGFVALPTESFNFSNSKFSDLDFIKIVHAPTDTDVKGTRFVRAAIDQLRSEGFAFEYTELSNVSHQDVSEVLFNSHICLNQFMGLGMGVLGIEAMAARCATFMTAFPQLEPSIPKPHVRSWIETRGSQLLENLRTLLANTEMIGVVANNGFDYSLENYSITNSSQALSQSLSRHKIIC